MESTETTRGSSVPARLYRFGDVVVDAGAHTLLRDGQARSVEPKAFAVLLTLLQHPGELVGREALLDAVWGHRHVTPGVLTRAIAQLRAVLQDDSHEPRYIQTQHALGYRFVGELILEPEAAITQPAPALASSLPVSPPLPMPQVHAQANAPGLRLPARRRHLWLLFPLVLVLLWVMVVGMRKFSGPITPPGASSIAVMPFTNLSSNREDDYFAEGLAVEMHDALASVEGLKVAAHMSARDDAMLGLDIKKVGATLGVASVLEATVRRDGQRVRINARLIDTDTGYTLWNQSYDRTSADVFATQGDIARDVVQKLMGRLPDAGQGLTRRLTPTRSVQAYDAYLKGRQQLNLPAEERKDEAAISFFSEALAADKDFVGAQIGICRSEISRFSKLREAAAHDRARAACELTQQMAPEAAEVNLVMGDYSLIRPATREAARYYQQAARDLALRADAYVGLAMVADADGQPKQALDYYEKALQLRPGDAKIHARIGFGKYQQGDRAGAIHSFRKAVQLTPGHADYWSTLGGLYLQEGNESAAVQAFNESLRIKPSDYAYNNLGAMKLEAGDYPAAINYFRQAIALEDADFLIWGNLADALRLNPATAGQAKAAYAEAAKRSSDYLLKSPQDPVALAALGWYSAALGNTSQARDLARRAQVASQINGEVAVFNTMTFSRLGDEAAAGKSRADAIALGIPQQRLDSSR